MTKKLGGILVAAALTASVMTGAGGIAKAEDGFYNTTDVAPGTPGEILKEKTAPYSNVLGSADSDLPNEATKIMYTTTDANGELVPVTGYVVEPTSKWRGKGPRPTVWTAPVSARRKAFSRPSSSPCSAWSVSVSARHGRP